MTTRVILIKDEASLSEGRVGPESVRRRQSGRLVRPAAVVDRAVPAATAAAHEEEPRSPRARAAPWR